LTSPSQAILRVTPNLAELPALIRFVESFAEEQTLKVSDILALTVATEELFSNTLRYSQPSATWVELALQPEKDVVIAVYRDNGGPFDPTHQPSPDTTLSAEARPTGGLGIEIIRRTMKIFRYQRLAGMNHVTFVRERNG
jgi:serine/threonine-protein kinase RsbW